MKKESSNPQDGKAAPYGSGYKKVTKEAMNIKKASTDQLKKIVKQSEDEKVSPAFASQLKLIHKELQKRKVTKEGSRPSNQGIKRKIRKAFLEQLVRETVQVTEKKKGIDGKACWKGYRYAGTKNGKDICIKAKGVKEGYYGSTQLEDEIQKYGYDSFEQFFADNPGAEEAVFDFIDQNLARITK